MNGVISAELAAEGFTDIPSILSFEKYRASVSDIGQNYLMVDGVTWKKYACCAWTHAALDAAASLRQTHRLNVDDIARIQVEALIEAVELGTKLPTTIEEAQFNMAWPLAALLTTGMLARIKCLSTAAVTKRYRTWRRESTLWNRKS
jgi:2-methylcitrate dehydratase PrpD